MTSSPITTISFADPQRGWYGLASTSGLAVLFRDREVAGVGSGDDLRLAIREHAPLERWSVQWEGPDCGFAIDVEAASAAVRSEQLAVVRGTTSDGGEIDGVGQVSTTEALDWSSLSLVRYVAAWLGDGGIVLESRRPKKAKAHADEQVWAALVERGDPVPVADPRLSTTYDGDGHQRRAGLELWLSEEEGYPVRAAGEVICGSSLDLGDLQLDLAFFRWRSEGAEGVGRYDILRKR